MRMDWQASLRSYTMADAPSTTMADAPSASRPSVKRKTNDGYPSDGFVYYRYCEVLHDNNRNWGLNRDVATRTENRYKEKPSQVMSLPLPIRIESYLAGNAPSAITLHPCHLYTTHGHVVYFYCYNVDGTFAGIHMYKSTIDTWYKLPNCPARDVFAIVMIHGDLTAVSGDHKLYTLTGQGAKQQWTEEYPPMPVDQNMNCLAAICVGEALIVFTCTGNKIMNTESKQWSTAASLLTNDHTYSEYHPGPPRVEFYDSHLWVFDPYVSKRTKYHLDAYLSSCEPPIFEHVVPAAQVSPTQCITRFSKGWTMSSNGTLICEDYDNHSCYCQLNRVIKYNPAGNSWELVGLLRKQEEALIVALPDNTFMTFSCCTNRRVLFFSID